MPAVTLQERAREALRDLPYPDLDLEDIARWNGRPETLEEIATRMVEYIAWMEGELDELQQAVVDGEPEAVVQVKRATVLLHQALQG